MFSHLHCFVAAGGLTPSGKWKASHSKGLILFPVKKWLTSSGTEWRFGEFRARFY
uniref:transposase n=1 Tax=Cyclobacterium xiamenense TaxID=1297121 RepID=UPI00115FE03F